MSKISVIVPIYKVEKFLPKCIESVLNQTFTDFELILVDDESPDRCPEICEDYAKKDKRVIALHKKNGGGVSDARNFGLDYVFSNSSSEYICMIDGDDYIHEQYLEKLYETITNENADISMCNYIYVDEEGNRLPNKNDKLVFKNQVLTTERQFNFLTFNWKIILVWNKLYKKEIFKNIRYPLKRLHQDEAVAHLVINACKKMAIINDALYYYVQHPESAMKTEKYDGRLDALQAFTERYTFLVDSPYPYKNDIHQGVYFENIHNSKYFNAEQSARFYQLREQYKKVWFKHYGNNFAKRLRFYNPTTYNVLRKIKHILYSYPKEKLARIIRLITKHENKR